MVVMVKCSRCKRDIGGIRDEGVTGGFYDAAGWPQFAYEGETEICDDCMFTDERYQSVYGGEHHISRMFHDHWLEFLKHYPRASYTPNPNVGRGEWMAVIQYDEPKAGNETIKIVVPYGYPVAIPDQVYLTRRYFRNPIMQWPEADPLGVPSFKLNFRIPRPHYWSGGWDPCRHTILTVARMVRNHLARR